MEPPPIAVVMPPPMDYDPILGQGQVMFINFYTDDVGFNVIVTADEARRAGFSDGVPTTEWFRERFTRYVTDRLTDDRPALAQMAEWASPVMLTAG